MQISHSTFESVLTIDSTGLVPGTTHELVIESYDDLSSLKGTLKTDTIKIIVAETIEAIKPSFDDKI